MLNSLPPFSLFYVAAVLIVMSPGRVRSFILLLTPLLAGLLLINQPLSEQPVNLVELTRFDLSLIPYRIDKLSLLFALLFIFTAFIANLFSLHVKDTSQQVAALIYSGSALGAVFAGDLLSLFLFWEMLAISSVFLIWAKRTDAALAAGFRYLIAQVISGILLLFGALIYYHQHQTLAFNAIELNGLGAWLIFIALAIKCAFPLLHTWLTDAYPEATATGTVFLSAFSTKVAVYALARGFSGTEILVEIGAIMTLFPILYALLENDLRRVLAYLMITQIGIMVVGIGIGTELALNGTAAHVVIHVVYKSLLFMTLGTVLYSTGKSKASELGNLYKTLPKTAALCLFATVFLLFSGFISKSLVMQAAIDSQHPTVWLILLVSAAAVFHTAIKVPYCAFFANKAVISKRMPPKNMLWAMYLATALCLTIAILPNYLYQLLPYPVNYWPYHLNHVITHLELACFAVLAFILLIKMKHYPITFNATYLDVDWLYRKPLKQSALWLYHSIAKLHNKALTGSQLIIQQPHYLFRRLFAMNGIFERMPASGIAISIILGFFALTLLIVLEI